MEKNVRSRTSSSSHPLSTSSSRVGLNSSSSLSPDQFSNILRNRSDFSQGSSIPTTPAPTPLLHVSHHMHPEQLVAGIKQLKIDEGYIDSTSFPGTPAPSPFSPSPAQALGFSPDQIAEGIKRLREEGAVSGNSTGQPPTPSTTPGLAVIPPNHNWEAAIPERLLETVRHLHCDEGLESGSNPATPVPTPTTGSLRGQQDYFPPEQLAAGIHRLKVEEGMSSGGSSGFPSTPAPTPFSHLAGGVLPEDLAAGISRLSVIEEADSNAPIPEQSVIVEIGNGDKSDGDNSLATAAILNSCRESNVNLPDMEVLNEKVPDEAEIQVEVAQANSQETTRTAKVQNPVDEIERPASLPTTSSNISSLYATPTAPTPVVDSSNVYSNYRKDIRNPSSSVDVITNVPITTPLSNLSVHSNITSPQLTLPPSFPEGPNDELGDELWIPNQFTAGVLKNIAKSPGTYFPEKTALTFTHLFSREENKDPIKNLVTHFHGPSEAARRSHIPNADTVSQDFEGLKLLIQSECYRSAITLTGRILESMGQVVNEQNHFIKHNPTSLEIWFIRLSLLVKLNLINKAEAEAEPFQPDGDKPDLYYDFYPSEFPGKSGPMISFSFRLLLAQIPQFHGKAHETLDRLYALWGKIKKILRNIPQDGSNDAQRRSWCQREIYVLYALVNSYLIQNDYVLAVETTMTLLEKERSERKAGVYSMLGRIYLQLGDVESSKKSFDSASELRNSNDQADVCNNLIDASLLAIGNNAYDKAFSILQKAREISNDPVIINNMSVCLLPQGRLAESLSLLETSITNDPVHYQFEEPIRNLSTLYDLESSYVGQKRQRLLGLIAQYKGDGFNPSCIQLPT